MIKKCVKLGMLQGLIVLLLFSNGYSEGSNFNLKTSKDLYSEFIHNKKSLGVQKRINLNLKKTVKVYDKKLIINSNLLKNCKLVNLNLEESLTIKTTQVSEWEKEYVDCNKDLVKAKQTPFYERWYFHFILGILSGVFVAK